MGLLAQVVRFPLRVVPDGLTVRILTGELRGWRWITGSATHGCWIGTYERETQRSFRELVRPGDIVYDIGANAGFFTLLSARLTGPQGIVYSFEPLKRNLAFLRRHLAVNEVSNADVLPLAISSRSGVAHFRVAANPAMGRLMADGGEEVRMESLDALVASGRIAPPQVMKIDVEGGEWDVLTGAADVLKSHRPAILLSTHGYQLHERCCALLGGLGYDLTLLRDGAVDGQYTVLVKG